MPNEGYKYLFVVGAGASREFDLPTGDRLVSEAAKLLKYRTTNDGFGQFAGGDELITQAFHAASTKDSLALAATPSQQINALKRESRYISSSLTLAPSIDNYIEAHKGDAIKVRAAKIAIARVILDAERRSPLYVDTSNTYNRLDFQKLKDNWLTNLFRVLSAGGSRKEFEERLSEIFFLCFNYDRVIEHFFSHAVAAYFDSSSGQPRADISGALNIAHVYGQVGELDYSMSGRGFGECSSGNLLWDAAQNINTFSEGVFVEGVGETVDRVISNVDAIVFLGFGFHPINMSLLKGGQQHAYDRIMGTSLGMSDDNLQIARSDLKSRWIFSRTEYYPEVGCAQLISMFSAYLGGRRMKNAIPAAR